MLYIHLLHNLQKVVSLERNSPHNNLDIKFFQEIKSIKARCTTNHIHPTHRPIKFTKHARKAIKCSLDGLRMEDITYITQSCITQ